MLFANLIIAGGMLYVGRKVYHRRKVNREQIWLIKPETPIVDTPSETIKPSSSPSGHYLAISTISLGLSASGALFYPPLGVASIPFNIYTTIPVLSNSIQRLVDERRLSVGLVVSTGVIVTLIKQDYLIASSLDWGYYVVVNLSQRFIAAFEQSYRQILYEFLNTTPQFVWVMMDDVEIKIPYKTLEIGDILIVDSIGIIPVQGVVTDGMATIDRYVATGEKEPITIQKDDVVLAATIVLSGRIYIQVTHI